MNNINIRLITLNDTDNIVKWRNQPFVRSKLFFQEEISSETHLQYYHDKIETNRVKQFIISIRNEGDPKEEDIGTAFLKNLDSHNKKAEFGIFIGEPSALGKGYGTIAIKKVLNYAFETLSLNRVYLQVLSSNIPAINAYKKSGFRIEGQLIQSYYMDDSFVDVYVMGITKSIWQSL